MHLESLVLTQFKNYADRAFEFGEGLNLLYGPNGAGKTNVLDAIHYLSLTRSYFNANDALQVMLSTSFFAVEGQVDYGQHKSRFRLWYQKGSGKKFMVNGNELPRFSDHVGSFPVVMIAPGDTSLIQEGSEVRRKWMDLVISQCDAQYLHALQHYQKHLDQRNKLLKDYLFTRQFDRTLLHTYNEGLVTYAGFIYRRRRQFLDDFKPLFLANLERISGGADLAALQLESDLNHAGMEQLLEASESADLDLGRTTKGPHRDDCAMLLSEQPVKKFGSQGQQKSFLIALKLAQFQYLESHNGQKPLLLLDDIFEKLDGNRLRELFHRIAEGGFGQIFITDTQAERTLEIWKDAGLSGRVIEVMASN